MLRQLHHTKAAVAIILVLTASLTSTALADPPSLAPAEATIAATSGSVPVQPNPDERAATPQPAYSGPCSEVCSGGAASYTPTHARVVSDSGGFHWADAGIGAAAAIVLLGLGLGGARAARNSRKRHRRQRGVIATS